MLCPSFKDLSTLCPRAAEPLHYVRRDGGQRVDKSVLDLYIIHYYRVLSSLNTHPFFLIIGIISYRNAPDTHRDQGDIASCPKQELGMPLALSCPRKSLVPYPVQCLMNRFCGSPFQGPVIDRLRVWAYLC